jgi:hypothetical protein
MVHYNKARNLHGNGYVYPCSLGQSRVLDGRNRVRPYTITPLDLIPSFHLVQNYSYRIDILTNLEYVTVNITCG